MDEEGAGSAQRFAEIQLELGALFDIKQFIISTIRTA